MFSSSSSQRKEMDVNWSNDFLDKIEISVVCLMFKESTNVADKNYCLSRAPNPLFVI